MVTIFRFMLCVAVFWLSVSGSNASRYIHTEYEDPFSDGVCSQVPQVSIGAVDTTESERLGVNWPGGLRPGIVLCNSGFIYFIGDGDLTKDEESSIRAFLNKVAWVDFSDIDSISPELLIWLLEEMYKRREVGSRFWLDFYQTIVLFGSELEAQRKSRVLSFFAKQYDDFHDDAQIHYVMAGHYARDRLLPEACESLYRGDRIAARVEGELSDVERINLTNLRGYAIADLLSSEDIRYGQISLSECDELRKENEHVPDHRDIP